MKPLLSLALLLLATSIPAATPEVKAAAKGILAQNQDSVLWVFSISSTIMRIEGDIPGVYRQNDAEDANENRSEFLATVIDAEGYLVASLRQLEGNNSYQPRGEGYKFTSVTQLKEMKVIQNDGTEIPADLILKDEELDVAILKIRSASEEAKGTVWKPVRLAEPGQAEMLDDVVSVGRMSASLGRTPVVSISELTGVVTKPRPLYIGGASLGNPLFALDGKLIGIGLQHQSPELDPDGFDSPDYVVLPAADVLKILEQAKKLPALKKAKDKPVLPAQLTNPPKEKQEASEPAARPDEEEEKPGEKGA